MRLTLALGCIVMHVSCSDDPTQLGTGRRSGTSSGVSSGAPGSSSGEEGSSGSGGTSGTSGTSGTTGTPSSGGGTAAEICVTTINDYRATKGLAPYARWTDNETCSDGQAKSDAMSKNPHGAFGKCQEFGQNECPDRDGPAEKMIPICLRDMWAEGPGGGHYEAMVNTKYTKVACGFGASSNGAIWSVQNFR